MLLPGDGSAWYRVVLLSLAGHAWTQTSLCVWMGTLWVGLPSRLQPMARLLCSQLILVSMCCILLGDWSCTVPMLEGRIGPCWMCKLCTSMHFHVLPCPDAMHVRAPSLAHAGMGKAHTSKQLCLRINTGATTQCSRMRNILVRPSTKTVRMALL